jgi:hypothetical protein
MYAWEPGRHSYSLPRICPRIAGERDVLMACRERQWQTGLGIQLGYFDQTV